MEQPTRRVPPPPPPRPNIKPQPSVQEVEKEEEAPASLSAENISEETTPEMPKTDVLVKKQRKKVVFSPKLKLALLIIGAIICLGGAFACGYMIFS